MPFIITTKPNACPEGMKDCRCVGHTFRAVATIEEARDYLQPIVRAPSSPSIRSELVSSVHTMPETGGFVGRLPDGTTIEVRPVTYNELRVGAGLVGVELYGLRDERRDQILDAYNTRQVSP
jgi:hypothetical protein